ncbi:hypothetical protein B1R32_105188 [Abditibacterium utsteinense]|uniref:S1/P1 Nuclease n=1 Tax=Abditibacterium utsteinense TaxID=1960156 RepID=A0A2S8SUN2_9BACT|nr:hypothetical protein [Abditibacterium utsteinense]PQV64505.1 hypothetical protein B1R32_105188 [Abditibacterium utsteinense]
MKKRLFFVVFPAISFLCPIPAHAWFPAGHSIIASAAVQSLPAEMPAWFRQGKLQIAHDAQDPDVQKSRDLPFMTEAEYPQHFFDYEMLQGRALPASRAEFTKLCAELKINPADVGEVPYAIAEHTQRLTMIFAEARRYPENPYIRTKALVEAGILSHYSGDICMPLHVTLSHDGRALPDGKSPKTGIHAKVDSLIERLDLKPEVLTKNEEVVAFPALFSAIEAQLMETRTKIDATYALEAALPDTKTIDKNWKPTPELVAFTTERARAATRFTASLFLTAWRDSAKIKLPEWLNREK